MSSLFIITYFNGNGLIDIHAVLKDLCCLNFKSLSYDLFHADD